MSNSRQRKKRAALKREACERDRREQFIREQRDAIVRKNMTERPERNYYAGIPSSSVLCSQSAARARGGTSRLTSKLKDRTEKPRSVSYRQSDERLPSYYWPSDYEG